MHGSSNPAYICRKFFHQTNSHLAFRPSQPGSTGGNRSSGSGNNPGNNRPSGPNSNNSGTPRPPGSGNAPRPSGGTSNSGNNRPFTPGQRPPGGPQTGGNRPQQGGRGYPPRQQQAEHRINEFIRTPEVRLVGENLEEIAEVIGKAVEAGIYPTSQLLRWAEEMGLDLVEISPNAVPPVVRIIDYNKFLYQRKKKEKEMKANSSKVELKEIRFGPETGDHDFEFKVRHAKNFLSEGNKVKAYVQFRGRAIVFKERGELLLLRFLKELEEAGAPEQLRKMDGKRMMVILSPKKPRKKKKESE